MISVELPVGKCWVALDPLLVTGFALVNPAASKTLGQIEIVGTFVLLKKYVAEKWLSRQLGLVAAMIVISVGFCWWIDIKVRNYWSRIKLIMWNCCAWFGINKSVFQSKYLNWKFQIMAPEYAAFENADWMAVFFQRLTFVRDRQVVGCVGDTVSDDLEGALQ